ncbi:kinetochore Sim4 complex subunit FTA2-domain-containing protein [Xylaria bambusicola]|uniref:kinetochore Sim4 complex subunit FTA2-domain-containing protein n=1 Tax=Xylaria bambusicola TaxID=326684 RepID=UPI0020077448|nr:kinetochore Sim4 complex subunit FTA2-domain-containing protein [Xylaria bambusicola]KAI0523943.1 kinetochore Sim4 complex subunit FTA2-domain-containing protein [Xylaria bambusicola]
MPRRRGLTSRADPPPLPPGGGPQLNPFNRDPSDTIKWIRRLDVDREENDGYVFHVAIGSKEYALKIFKFSHPLLNRFYRDLCLQSPLPLKEGIWYTDPFYAECRAYGRIQEGFESRLVTEQTAVKCYGYLLLDEDDSRWLKKEGIDLDQHLLDPELCEALGGDTRVRAIVKEFEKSPFKIHARNIRRAWRSVCLLNNCLELYNMDIKAENFIGYRLVDFGSSWTEPHKLLDFLEGKRENTAKAFRLKDTVNFKNMIEEENIQTRLKVLAKSEHQLRSKGKPEWADRELPKRRRIAST